MNRQAMGDSVMGQTSKGPLAQACFPHHCPRVSTDYATKGGWDARTGNNSVIYNACLCYLEGAPKNRLAQINLSD